MELTYKHRDWTGVARMVDGKWNIQLDRPMPEGWGKRRRKTASGRWITTNYLRTKFKLVWEGSRFAHPETVKLLKEVFPGLYRSTMAFINKLPPAVSRVRKAA